MALTNNDVTDLFETSLGMGDRFNHVLEKVRAQISQSSNRVRLVKDMMKTEILTYIKNTHDVITGRQIFNKAIMSGFDTMLTVVATVMIANTLVDSYRNQAEALLKGIASKLGGKQDGAPIGENASGAAVSAGAIATVPNSKKKQILRRQSSIFAENYVDWEDLEGKPDIMQKLAEVVDSAKNRRISNILVDPTTAELILAVRESLTPDSQSRFEAKPLNEMIQIAYRAVQRGLIQVVMETV